MLELIEERRRQLEFDYSEMAAARRKRLGLAPEPSEPSAKDQAGSVEAEGQSSNASLPLDCPSPERRVTLGVTTARGQKPSQGDDEDSEEAEPGMTLENEPQLMEVAL